MSTDVKNELTPSGITATITKNSVLFLEEKS